MNSPLTHYSLRTATPEPIAHPTALLLRPPLQMLPPSELSQIGFTLAAYPFATLNPAIVAMREALRALGSETEDAIATRARFGLPFAELQRVVGFPQYYEQEARYKD